MKINFSILLLLFILIYPVAAQDKKITILEQRSADVVNIINSSQNLDKFLTPSLLAIVPPDKFAEIGKSLTDNYGKAIKILKVTPQNEYSGEIKILFEKNFVGTALIAIEPTSPNLISGLQITGFEPVSNSLSDLIEEMKKLPGEKGFTAVRLNGKDFTSLAAYNADKQFAIGSTFKLYILAELIRSISAGERKWSDVVELNEKSLPSGQLQNWEKGAPITLHTLASMMISISDNTATDQLIETLGREKIEKMLATANNSNPARSTPFLKTSEMFKLKGALKENFASDYLAKDLNGKRLMLGKEIAAFDMGGIDLSFLQKPKYVSQIEWYASPADLARVMNWIMLNTEKSTADKARGVLTINKALPDSSAKDWQYVGYKGGSETGVISLTYLLKSKKGEWFVVSGSWNDENAPVDDMKFVGLMQKAVSLVGQQ